MRCSTITTASARSCGSWLGRGTGHHLLIPKIILPTPISGAAHGRRSMAAEDIHLQSPFGRVTVCGWPICAFVQTTYSIEDPPTCPECRDVWQRAREAVKP